MFVLKDMLHTNPMETFTKMVLTSVVVLAYLHRLAERDYDKKNTTDSTTSTEYFWNSLWFILVTMPTVGYGDTYPHTHFGRFVAALTMGTGIIFVAMLVTIFTENIELTGPEEAVVTLLDEEEKKLMLSHSAARLLGSWWKTISNLKKRAKAGDEEALRSVATGRGILQGASLAQASFAFRKAKHEVEWSNRKKDGTQVEELPDKYENMARTCTMNELMSEVQHMRNEMRSLHAQAEVRKL